MDEAQGKENEDEYLVRRILSMNLASLHTVSLVRLLYISYHVLFNVGEGFYPCFILLGFISRILEFPSRGS